MTLYFGPDVDSSGNLFNYESEDGKTWKKKALGRFTPFGFVSSSPHFGTVSFTDKEAEAWKATEPDFPKPIVKRLSDDSYHDRDSDDKLPEPGIFSCGTKGVKISGWIFRSGLDLGDFEGSVIEHLRRGKLPFTGRLRYATRLPL